MTSCVCPPAAPDVGMCVRVLRGACAVASWDPRCPLCAACQTWLTCDHLSSELPWVHNGLGELGPTREGGRSRGFRCPHSHLHLVVSAPAPRGHSSSLRRYLTRRFRMSPADGPGQERCHDNEVGCRFPPLPPRRQHPGGTGCRSTSVLPSKHPENRWAPVT